MRPRPEVEAVLAWLKDALADPLLPAHHTPLVGRLNMAIAQLARTRYFDLRELSQLLKEARDAVEEARDAVEALTEGQDNEG